MKGRVAGTRGPRVAPHPRPGRSPSSKSWLARQLNDPYVAAAKAERFRSRSAYKLLELNDRFHLIRAGARVVDLGAAPGGWTQAALTLGARIVVAVDIAPMAPIAGAALVEADAADPGLPVRLQSLLGGPAEVLLSDMAPATTGHAATDYLRIMALAEQAFAVAEALLAADGSCVVKLFQGGAEATLLASLKRRFSLVRHAKPPASRRESRELYLVAKGFVPGVPTLTHRPR